jgi:tRNA pseudouridine synthase 10
LVKIYEKKITPYKKAISLKLIQYNLFICKYCFERNFKNVEKKIIKYKTSVNIVRSEKKECNICKNLFQKTIITIRNDIINSYQFVNANSNKTIEIGSTIPFKLFEKEDNLRSLFKIKGVPNIKNHYNAIIRYEVIKETGFSLNHLNPDIRIEIIVDNKLNYEIKYKTKEILLLGRYNKYQRGLIQRFKKNNMNNNEQGFVDNYNTHENTTIEDIILEFLYNQSGSKDIKIGWSGSEDKDSLVLGNGRPFIVKINSPQSRDFQKMFDIKDKLSLNFQEIAANDSRIYDKYKIQVKTLIRVIEDSLEKADLEKIIFKLIGETKYQMKNKIVKKKIYSSSYKIIDKKNFEMNLVLDNGIPIKQLIGGDEFIEPCLSNLLNKKCECVFFDIYNIILNNNLTEF